MGEPLTVERLRKLREIQKGTSELTPADDESPRVENTIVYPKLRPLEERNGDRRQVAIYACVIVWLSCIVVGTVSAWRSPHAASHTRVKHSKKPSSRHEECENVACLQHTAPSPTTSAVYAVHTTLETTPSDIFTPSAYPRSANVTALGGASRGFVMGPFATQPGEWVSAYVTEEMVGIALSSVEHVIEFTGDGVDASGNALPFPPLHVHHIHILRGRPPPAHGLQQHWMETHGDYALDPVRGYATPTPPGYCRVRGSEPLSVWAQLVDVRSHSLSARPLQWWLRIRFVLSPVACRPISKLLIWCEA